MTLTELRYVVALAQERHFGRAAQRCFVTQPTLSLALQKLEDELGLKLFERNKNEVLVTAKGTQIVEQARKVLDEAGKITSLAKGGDDPLEGPLRLGVIPTIGPYLLPELVPVLKQQAPKMPLEIEENLTGNLAPMLREGELDCIIIALPFHMPGVLTRALYDEQMSVVTPGEHKWKAKKSVRPADLAAEHVLMLNIGHCFRDQVLDACPGQLNTAGEGRAGSSLETIRSMVASGFGISVMPEGALQKPHMNKLIRAIPFADPVPARRVALAWRDTYTRMAAVDAIARAVTSIHADWLRKLGPSGRVQVAAA